MILIEIRTYLLGPGSRTLSSKLYNNDVSVCDNYTIEIEARWIRSNISNKTPTECELFLEKLKINEKVFLALLFFLIINLKLIIYLILLDVELKYGIYHISK